MAVEIKRIGSSEMTFRAWELRLLDEILFTNTKSGKESLLRVKSLVLTDEADTAEIYIVGTNDDGEYTSLVVFMHQWIKIRRFKLLVEGESETMRSEGGFLDEFAVISGGKG